VAVVGAGAVAEAEDGAEVETAAAGAGAGAEVEAAAVEAGDVVGDLDWRLGVEVNPGEECWWVVLDSSTEETMDGSARLEEALKTFAMSVEVAGLRGDGHLLNTELEDVSGGKGWRLSVIRLRKRGEVLEVQAVCVVSKARGIARSSKVYRMQALAVKEEQRGRGLAAEALRRLQVELRELAGTDYRMVTNMAACMAKKGVGFYGSQGWTGGSGVWEWDSRTAPSRGSRGKLQMEGKSLQRRWKCKRQLEGAEGEGGVRGWVEDAAAEAAVVQYRGMTGGGVCMLLRPECEYDGRDERSGEGIED
jgi:hypothetical protein